MPASTQNVMTPLLGGVIAKASTVLVPIHMHNDTIVTILVKIDLNGIERCVSLTYSDNAVKCVSLTYSDIAVRCVSLTYSDTAVRVSV